MRVGEQMLIDAQRLVIETDEGNLFDAAFFDARAHGGDGDFCGALRWEAIDASADGGKGERLCSKFMCELKAATITAGQEIVFAMSTTVPDGADGVKYPFGRQAKAGGSFGIACGAAVELAAGREQLGACGAVNGSVYASAAE